MARQEVRTGQRFNWLLAHSCSTLAESSASSRSSAALPAWEAYYFHTACADLLDRKFC
jgi:hypothetical protein